MTKNETWVAWGKDSAPREDGDGYTVDANDSNKKPSGKTHWISTKLGSTGNQFVCLCVLAIIPALLSQWNKWDHWIICSLVLAVVVFVIWAAKTGRLSDDEEE